MSCLPRYSFIWGNDSLLPKPFMFHVTKFSLVEPEFLLVGILALCVLGTVGLSMVPDLIGV